MSPSVLGIDHGVEKERDEIGEVVGVEMRKENVRDPVAVDAGFDEIAQGARAKIQQQRLVRTHQITGRRAPRMNVRAGSQNGQLHRRVPLPVLHMETIPQAKQKGTGGLCVARAQRSLEKWPKKRNVGGEDFLEQGVALLG